VTPITKVGFIVILFAPCFDPTVVAQVAPPQLIGQLSPRVPEAPPMPEANVKARTPEGSEFKLKPKDTVRFHKTSFIILSTGVYAAALADMHQTLKIRNSPTWAWVETDPFAKPIVRLPAPAYYATGLAMATGLNLLSWKLGHMQRWRKLSFIPQVLTIGGNLDGYRSNRY
jgi:hypothetical protein